jgi:hypothetical protein
VGKLHETVASVARRIRFCHWNLWRLFQTRLLSFEKKDGTMAKVKVDEVLRFFTILVFSRRFGINVGTVGNEAAKVTTDYAMPCGSLSFIKLRDALVELNTRTKEGGLLRV